MFDPEIVSVCVVVALLVSLIAVCIATHKGTAISLRQPFEAEEEPLNIDQDRVFIRTPNPNPLRNDPEKGDPEPFLPRKQEEWSAPPPDSLYSTFEVENQALGDRENL